MKNNLIKSAGVLLLATAMICTIEAQPGPRGGQGYGTGPGQTIEQGHPYARSWNQGKGQMAHMEALGLTEQQKEEFEALRLEQYKVMKPLRNKMEELKARERTLMSEEKVDLKKVNAVIDEQTTLINQMRKLQAAHHVKMKSILSDAQVMKLEQHLEMRKHRRADGQGFHRKTVGHEFLRNPGTGRVS